MFRFPDGKIELGGQVQDVDLQYVICTAVTARVPRSRLVRYAAPDPARPPRLGDVVLARVDTVGDDDRLEAAASGSVYATMQSTMVPQVQTFPTFATLPLLPGQLILAAIGGRYALDYLLADVPDYLPPRLDLLTFGGVVGRIIARNSSLEPTSVVQPLAYFEDADGIRVNTRDVVAAGPCAPLSPGNPPIALVTGGSMESGKTTAARAIVQGLTGAGCEVFAGKATGCGSFRDPHRIASGGAVGTTDFMALGYPSTHGVEGPELLRLFWRLVNLLAEVSPRTRRRWIVIELADGLAQPETRQILQDPDVRRVVQKLVYAAPDPLSAAGGLNLLQRWGWSRPIVSGPVASSQLGRDEVNWLCPGTPLMFLDSRFPPAREAPIWSWFEQVPSDGSVDGLTQKGNHFGEPNVGPHAVRN